MVFDMDVKRAGLRPGQFNVPLSFLSNTPPIHPPTALHAFSCCMHLEDVHLHEDTHDSYIQ